MVVVAAEFCDLAIAATGQELAILTIKSAPGGADLPWTFGHVFRKGDVPSGQFATVSESSAQVIPKATWTDGSLRHAIISGRTTLGTGVAHDVTVSVSSSAQNPGGATITESVLSGISATTSISFGAFGTVTLASLIGSPHRTWIAGPIMSSWVYWSQIGADPNLTAWFEVRAYQGGAIEILPWIENTVLNSGLNKSARAIFTLGGTVKYDSVSDITCYNHARLCLMQGVFSHWSGANPQIRPKHDGAYLRSTKMVVNYAWPGPSEAAMTNDLVYDGGGTPWILTFTPNGFANTRDNEAPAGFHASLALMSSWDAIYIGSGDPRMWDTMLANHHSHSIMAVHHRDPLTNEPVILSANHASTGASITDASGGTPDVFHHPNQGYLPYLMTGWHFFLDSLKFRAGWAMIQAPTNYRGPPPGIPCQWGRGMAWTIRSCSNMLAALPTGAAATAGDTAAGAWLTEMFEHASVYYVNDQFVLGAPNKHPLGLMTNHGSWGSTLNYTCGFRVLWFDEYIAAALGWASDLNLPLTANGTNFLTQWRNYQYEAVLGFFGATGGPTEMCWSRGPYVHHHFDGPDLTATYASNLHPTANGFTSWDTVFQWTYGNGAAGGPPLQPQSSQTCSLTIHANDDPLDAPGQNFVNYFPAYMTPVLAMARDHGIHPDYWTRWAAAPNFPANVNDGQLFRNAPLWAIGPRT